MMDHKTLDRLERNLRHEQAAYRRRQWQLLLQVLAAPIRIRAAELRDKETRT